jgi:hypothetical protein
MTAGFDLGAAQFGTEPAEDEEDEETPVNADQGRSGFGQIGSALRDTFGQKSTFALRPPPLQGAQFGSSPGFAAAPKAGPIAIPYEQRQAEFAEHARNSLAAFHGPGSGRQSTLARSAADVARQYGAAGQGQ